MTDTTANAAHFEAHEAHAHHDADHKPGFFARWFMSTNHKDIGTLYLIFAIFAGIVGGAFSGMMRAELAQPGIQYLATFASWFGETNPNFDQQLHLWNVLITAHGNSLRALVKYLDNISDQDIVELNIPTGIPLVYELDANLTPLKHYYLGDAEAAARAAQAVANQASKR